MSLIIVPSLNSHTFQIQTTQVSHKYHFKRSSYINFEGLKHKIQPRFL